MSASEARLLDQNDELKPFQKLFHYPKINNKKCIYFCGNSLGLQPKTAKAMYLAEIEKWAKYGVEGHFIGKNPWVSYHESFAPILSKLVGAKKHEVVAMNTLTTNLHLAFATFYKPKGKKTKILTEAINFPSDIYAIKSQLAWHGQAEKKNIIELKPPKGKETITTSYIIEHIKKHKNELALIFLSGVNYYNGQAYDLELISQAAKKEKILIGFDLAHAIGNIPLKLHKWDIDFAVWCSYKYLNAGPGAVGGLYIHENHCTNTKLKRLSGWWGNNPDNRFKMNPDFDPIPSVDGWQLSNAPIFNMIGLKASLEIFEKAGIHNLVKKAHKMTYFLEKGLQENCHQQNGYPISIISPESIDERGCQISIKVHKKGKELFDILSNKGFIVDWRNPDVIRVAPVPLYNSYTEIWKFIELMSNYCQIKKG